LVQKKQNTNILNDIVVDIGYLAVEIVEDIAVDIGYLAVDIVADTAVGKTFNQIKKDSGCS
jgi:hypothetical protein